MGCNSINPRASFALKNIFMNGNKLKIQIVNHVNADGKNSVDGNMQSVEFLLSFLSPIQLKFRSIRSEGKEIWLWHCHGLIVPPLFCAVKYHISVGLLICISLQNAQICDL